MAAREEVAVQGDGAAVGLVREAADGCGCGCPDVELMLAVRGYWFELFHGAFGGPPTEALLQAVREGASQGLFGLGSRDGADVRDDSDAACRLAALAEGSRWDAEALDRLTAEYTRLFVGPGHLQAPPWESQYVGVEGLLFQESILEVRYAYAAQGFVAREYPKVADDHIALMMDFLGQMSARTLEHWRAGRTDPARELLQAQRAFEASHLANWLPDYAARLRQAEADAFYATMAECALEVVQQDLQAFDQLCDMLGDAD